MMAMWTLFSIRSDVRVLSLGSIRLHSHSSFTIENHLSLSLRFWSDNVTFGVVSAMEHFQQHFAVHSSFESMSNRHTHTHFKDMDVCVCACGWSEQNVKMACVASGRLILYIGRVEITAEGLKFDRSHNRCLHKIQMPRMEERKPYQPRHPVHHRCVILVLNVLQTTTNAFVVTFIIFHRPSLPHIGSLWIWSSSWCYREFVFPFNSN